MFFEAIAFMIAFPLCLIMTKWILYADFEVDELRMMRLFAMFWDGNPSHERDAWKAVLHRLQEKKAHKKEILYVKERIWVTGNEELGSKNAEPSILLVN